MIYKIVVLFIPLTLHIQIPKSLLLRVTDVLMSPPPGVSVADRFSSPSPGSAKRRLFSVLTQQPSDTSVSTENTRSEGGSLPGKTTQIIAFQQAQTNDGRQVGERMGFPQLSICIRYSNFLNLL